MEGHIYQFTLGMSGARIVSTKLITTQYYSMVAQHYHSKIRTILRRKKQKNISDKNRKKRYKIILSKKLFVKQISKTRKR